MWRYECSLWAKRWAFRQKVEKAQKLVDEFIQGNRVYVAFSGGKDSSVILDMARYVDKNIVGVFGDDEWNFPETLELVNSIDNIITVKSKRKHTDWFESYTEGGVRDVIAHIIGSGYNGCILGLRAEESAYRKKYLRAYGMMYQSKRQIQCNPIAWWGIRDVWAYIFSRDVNYNKAYEKYTVHNVPFKYQRIGPFANEKVLGYGQLAKLRLGWPTLFQKFADKYPQVWQYV
jgi:3'-phosphoadenosine 5'-phosphosulfate sulfotransferase (PAPS reductase)/FAD synthetase